MIFERINNLVDTSGDTINTATFPEIKNSLMDAFKQIYGNDIFDDKGLSADEEYLMMISLIYNNVLRGLDTIKGNLNPSSASGSALDILASFNNIKRKEADYSTAECYVKYTGVLDYWKGVDNSLPELRIEAKDKAGKTWIWKEGKNFDGAPVTKFMPNKIYKLKFTCTEVGPISAYADSALANITTKLDENLLTDSNHGDIGEVTSDNYPFEIWQASDAVTGNLRENDAQLRARRIKELSATSATSIESLLTNLLELPEIVDAKIYVNNNISGAMTANDGTTIEPHSIYICLRYLDGVEPDENSIANTIYYNLPPGIPTSSYTENEGYAKTGEAITRPISNFTPEGVEFATQNISWKKITGTTLPLELKFMIADSYIKDNHEADIKEVIKEYAYNIDLNKELNMVDLIYKLNSKAYSYGQKKIPYMMTDGDFIISENNKSKTCLPQDTFYTYIEHAASVKFDKYSTTSSKEGYKVFNDVEEKFIKITKPTLNIAPNFTTNLTSPVDEYTFKWTGNSSTYSYSYSTPGGTINETFSLIKGQYYKFSSHKYTNGSKEVRYRTRADQLLNIRDNLYFIADKPENIDNLVTAEGNYYKTGEPVGKQIILPWFKFEYDTEGTNTATLTILTEVTL